MRTSKNKRRLFLLTAVFAMVLCVIPANAASNPGVVKSITQTQKSSKTSKKTVKLKRKSKKTYQKKSTSVKYKPSKSSVKGNQKIVVKTTIKTQVTESYKKNSYKKTVTTKKDTTITTTTTTYRTYEVSIDNVASRANVQLRKAYNLFNFKVVVNPLAPYNGYFSAKDKQITLLQEDSTVYHEIGHFLAFVAGNSDKKSSFISIYNEEKNKYTGINKAYVTQNSSEYYAESYRDYVLNPQGLKNTRPKTYATIVNDLNKLNDSYILRVKEFYHF